MASIKGYPRSVAVTLIRGGLNATPLGPGSNSLDTGDDLIAVLEVPSDGSLSSVTDHILEASIPKQGHVQLTTTDTTGDYLLVLYQQLNV